MKTGDEQFDDLIRKKLDGSEVQPPSNLFNQIVPEEKKRRGFLWLWLAGICVIISTALLVHQQTISHRLKNSDSLSHSSMSTIQKEDQIVLSETENNKDAVSDANPHVNGAMTNAQEEAGHNVKGNEKQNKGGVLTTKSAAAYDDNVTALLSPVKIKKKNQGSSKKDGTVQQQGYNTINYDQLYTPSSGLSSNVNLIHPLNYIPQDDRPLRKVETTKKQITEFNSHLPGKWSVEAGGGFIVSKESLNSSSADTSEIRLINQMKDDLETGKGWYLHAGVIRQLNEHFSLSVITEFSQIKSSSTTQFTEYYKITEYDTISYPILFPFIPPVIFTSIDSMVISKSTIHTINHNRNVTAFTVGSSLQYTIPVKNFIIEPHAGIRFRVMQSIKGESSLNAEFISKDPKENYKTALSPSLNAGINIGYSISEKVSAFFQPSYEYIFGNQAKKESPYQSKISNIRMGIGVRYTFFRKEATQITPMLSDK